MLTVRKVSERDRPLLDAAAMADPYHAALGIQGGFWLQDPPNTLFYEDEMGPVVALRTRYLNGNVAWVNIQFLADDNARQRSALLEGFWTYVDIMHKRGIVKIMFDTLSPNVARFFCKRFGFQMVSNGIFALRID